MSEQFPNPKEKSQKEEISIQLAHKYFPAHVHGLGQAFQWKIMYFLNDFFIYSVHTKRTIIHLLSDLNRSKWILKQFES